MSKQNPNQMAYKIGGRAQSDGPDRGEVIHEKPKFAAAEKNVKRTAKKK
ncbi:MAG TPA: hypothetical protein VNA69_01515 [Thermoanaerobaculia bacterium]|nr:hypothetical protein [Thermoanaerobaculia bacterium]